MVSDVVRTLTALLCRYPHPTPTEGGLADYQMVDVYSLISPPAVGSLRPTQDPPPASRPAGRSQERRSLRDPRLHLGKPSSDRQAGAVSLAAWTA